MIKSGLISYEELPLALHCEHLPEETEVKQYKPFISQRQNANSSIHQQAEHFSYSNEWDAHSEGFIKKATEYIT